MPAINMARVMPPEAVESAKTGLKVTSVVIAFCAALVLGFFKGLLVGPVAALLLILGNVGVLLGLFPAHVYWIVLTIIKTNRINVALKLLFLLALPIVFGLWLALGIVGSVLVGLGYGFFAPWVSTFEAFRQDRVKDKFLHCITDGTWGTIKGSCTVVRDFADICYHSIPLYLKELRDSSEEHHLHTIRLVDVPACIVVALIGLIVEIPLYTAIAIIKSPYMLFKGWQRLSHDLISGEGPFLETSCVPIAGLAILLWPLVVAGCIVVAFLSSIFIGLYGAVIVYQERSFRRGLAYVVAMIWEELMTACEIGGKQLVDANVLTTADLKEWFKAKGNNQGRIVGLGLPSYCLLDSLVFSIKAGSGGIALSNGVEVNHLNRPQDRVLDWFFHPVMVLKEQIKVINMSDGEMRFLEKLVLLGSNEQRMVAWENGSVIPQDALKTAQIQAISRRLVGMTGSISKFPTYRRRFQYVVKQLITYSLEKETSHISQLDKVERGSFRALGSFRSQSRKSYSSIEAVHAEV
ncbi:hypothetical protein Taro_037211 [Colocasia esculenta]|uniref:Uncharacterized protein n=1 Tax=Colocasia esculenta TaxID=4460 RepID=A0A843WK50_COLES|nr:hypothetical protein [Colocasia esculenta]